MRHRVLVSSGSKLFAYGTIVVLGGLRVNLDELAVTKDLVFDVSFSLEAKLFISTKERCFKLD